MTRMHTGTQCVEIRHQDVRVIGQRIAAPPNDVFGAWGLAWLVAGLTRIRLRE